MRISAHAIERFIERSSKLWLPVGNDAWFRILELVNSAKRERLPECHNKNRQKYNRNIYLVNAGWRFVLTSDGELLITVERVRHEEN
jgi:hypothetical protein